MRATTTLLLLPALICYAGFAHAQSLHVIGTVQGNKSEPVVMANVSLLQASDSSWIKTEQTNEQGSFDVKDVAAGKYVLDIQAFGHQPKKIAVSVERDVALGVIVLEAVANKMEEVVVTGRKDRIETELGKTILNVNEQMKTGSTLLDILRKTPGVLVSPDGTISVEGKQGVMVMIDDKPMQLSGKDLAEYLRGVNASEVVRVELMTQPSAKYDAEGNTGIINIQMSKKKKQGWTGVATANYQQGMYPYKSINSNAKYTKGRTAYTFNPGYYEGQSFMKQTSETKSLQGGQVIGTVKEEAFMKERFPDYSLITGIDHDVNDKTTLSTTVRGVYHTNKETDKTQAIVQNNNSTNYNNTQNDNGHVRKNLEANVFAKHNIDSNQKVEVNAGYFLTRRDMYQDIDSRIYNEQGALSQTPLLLHNDITDNTNLYIGKADYTGNFGKDTKVECGVKSSYATIELENKFVIDNNGQWVNDTTRSNRFLYNEHINAAYVSASTKMGNVQMQGGLRVENTIAKGDQVTQNEQFDRNYTKLFPTAYVTYKIDENNTVECNYGKRLQRPNYRELNPFTRVISQYNISKGNPMLAPQYTSNIQLRYIYKGHLNVTLSHSCVTGVYTDRLEFDNNTGKSIYTVGNNGRKTMSMLQAYYNNQLTEWFNLTLNGNANYVTYEAEYNGADYYATGLGCNAGIDTQFTFKKGWSAGMNVYVNSPFRSSVVQTVRGMPWMSAQVAKDMFKDTLNLKLGFEDPFYMYNYTRTITQPNTAAYESSKFNTQGVSLALSYNFGKRDELRKRDIGIEETSRM